MTISQNIHVSNHYVVYLKFIRSSSIISQLKQKAIEEGTLLTLHVSHRTCRLMGTTANLSLGRTPCEHSGTQTMEACEELLQATSHSPPYLTCHGRLSGDSFSLPPEASCPVLLGIELQNMKPLSCRLELAP